MRQIPGVVTGIVKSLKDPEGQGRIQVQFPWLSENQKSAWASVAAAMAGNGRGAFFMPELEDEVLVAFDHGDFAHPFIVGFLWNGVDKPPDSDINPSVRRLKTVSGHTLDFDDRGGSKRISIRTANGHEIEMKDAGGGSVTITTKGGQVIKMDDVSPGISITTAAQNSIQISDTPAGITLSVQAGTLTVNCLQANVTASSLLNVSAPMTVFSGVVQIPTLIAQAVVGSSYTPAPGNTFGL